MTRNSDSGDWAEYCQSPHGRGESPSSRGNGQPGSRSLVTNGTKATGERAKAEAVLEGMLKRRPDYEDALARFTAELGLESSLRARDAVATVIWRRRWACPRYAGCEWAYIRKVAYAIMHGLDDIRPLRRAVQIEEPGTNRRVPAIVGNVDTILRGYVEIDDRRVRYRLITNERRRIDMSRLRSTGLSADAIAVLRARHDGISHSQIARHLCTQPRQMSQLRIGSCG
jgi:hypothetical protein